MSSTTAALLALCNLLWGSSVIVEVILMPAIEINQIGMNVTMSFKETRVLLTARVPIKL